MKVANGLLATELSTVLGPFLYLVQEPAGLDPCGIRSAAAQAEDQMEGGLLLDVVVCQTTPVLELLTRKYETLLVGRDSLLILDLAFDIVDGIRRLDFQCNGLASQGFYKDLHLYINAPPF
tara:strand:- start:1559 stop:1921 length:363 start_codon:yes stop_codon:yes gene_type:complete